MTRLSQRSGRRRNAVSGASAVLILAGTFAVALVASSPALASSQASGRGGVATPQTHPLAGGAWNDAEKVPGTATLNLGGFAITSSVSCPSPGNCAAGGSYRDSSSIGQAFVANETNGTWGDAEEVPGTAALSAGAGAGVDSVSCSSAGNCAAVGSYTDNGGEPKAYVVTETDGTWGNAEKAPALNRHASTLASVSCASAGNCAAGGSFEVRSGIQAWVVSETRGTWGAEEVPGMDTLNTGGYAEVLSVSCGSPGNCALGGRYADSPGHSYTQAFVADESSGTWGDAEEVPNTAALNKGGQAQINSVSCASAGSCAAGGFYLNSPDHYQAFVASESSGTWGDAKKVPGTANLNAGNYAEVVSVSCASEDDCAAGGFYTDSSGHIQTLVANEANGTWGDAEEVPGTETLNAGGNAELWSVSCPSAGNCAAGGYYRDTSGHQQVFVVNEKSGTWRKAEEVPGTATLNARVTPRSGRCRVHPPATAQPGGTTQAFAASRPSSSIPARLRPRPPRSCPPRVLRYRCNRRRHEPRGTHPSLG